VVLGGVLVGAEGSVTTVDIDRDIVARADDGLRASGYDRVQVVHADAEHGVPRYASYDRIIVTVGAWDIPVVGRSAHRTGPNRRPAALRRAYPLHCVRPHRRDWSAPVTDSAASRRCRAAGRLLSSSCRSTLK
jgi:hypothetical protein